MPQAIKTLTAETDQGRQAIQEIIQLTAYDADINSVPPPWAMARLIDNVPVSFILVDPDRQMAFPGGDLRYGFICDVATRPDRRREGHFRALVQETFARLQNAGIPLVVTHGRYPLYRPFKFDTFTHHSGIFVTPEQVERMLGTTGSEEGQDLLTIEAREALHDDLLLITDVQAETLDAARVALQAAAYQARERGKSRILFEHPSAPSYGSRYPPYTSLETPLTAMARTCGAQVCVQGADPEGGTIPDADWIQVLDAALFLQAACQVRETGHSLRAGRAGFVTDAGSVMLESSGETVRVSQKIAPQTPVIEWPSAALAQWVTGYRSVKALAVIASTPLPDKMAAFLGRLFPPQWRLSRNESWTFKS